MRVGLLGAALTVAVSGVAMAQAVNADLSNAVNAPKSIIVVAQTAPPAQNDPRYLTPYGSTPWDGVAQLYMRNAGGNVASGCTGTLLDGGRAILTAAHCVSNGASLTAFSVDVRFLGPLGFVTYTVSTQSQIHVRSGYNGSVINTRDVAVLYLDRTADAAIPRYGLFQGNPLLAKASLVGFGTSGTGLTGANDGNNFFNNNVIRRQGNNRWEATCSTGGSCTANGAGQALRGVLLDDFDNGLSAPAAQNGNGMCRFFGMPLADPTFGPMLCQTGYGLDEVGLGPGDSGGPGFLGQQIAGVASFLATLGGDPFPSGGFQSLNGHACVANYVSPDAGFANSDDCAANYGFVTDQMALAAVPEPATFALLATGLGLVGLVARRRRA